MRKVFLFARGSGHTEVRYTLEPNGKLVRARSAMEALESGWMVPLDRGLPLFGDDPTSAQSWVTRAPTEEELAHASSLSRCAASTEEMTTMDVRRFIKPQRFKYAELQASGPQRGAIVEVKDGEKYDRPDMTVEVDGLLFVLGLNTGNMTRLGAAWGWDTDRWTGRTVEIEAGEAAFGNGTVESIIAAPVGPPATPEERKSASASSPSPDDDGAPFAPEWR
jgi:hypothetical protein